MMTDVWCTKIQATVRLNNPGLISSVGGERVKSHHIVVIRFEKYIIGKQYYRR